MRRIRHREATKIAGKTHPASIPAFMLSPAFCVITPMAAGPIDAPKSPAIARNANNPVPPKGILPDAILMEPGHMMPTENPQTIQPISPKTGLAEMAASK